MSRPDIKVVKHGSVCAGDVVAGLRNIADNIENGRIPANSIAVVAHRHGDVEKVVWALGHYDPMQTLGILQRAIYQVNRDIS